MAWDDVILECCGTASAAQTGREVLAALGAMCKGAHGQEGDPALSLATSHISTNVNFIPEILLECAAPEISDV